MDRAEIRIPIPRRYPIRKYRWVVLDRFDDPGFGADSMEWRALRTTLSHCGRNGWLYDVFRLQLAKVDTRSSGPVGHGPLELPGERRLLPIVRFRRIEARSDIVPELLICLGALDDFVS